jgi:hypothetical protein
MNPPQSSGIKSQDPKNAERNNTKVQAFPRWLEGKSVDQIEREILCTNEHSARKHQTMD